MKANNSFVFVSLAVQSSRESHSNGGKRELTHIDLRLESGEFNKAWFKRKRHEVDEDSHSQLLSWSVECLQLLPSGLMQNGLAAKVS